MIKLKCRFGFKQYMPKKPTKWGAKVFALCDVKTAYLWNFNIYTGRGEDEKFAEYSNTTLLSFRLPLSCTYLSGELTEGAATGVTWWTKQSASTKHAVRCANCICIPVIFLGLILLASKTKRGVRGPSPEKNFHFKVAEPPFFNSECSESGMTRNRKMVKTSPLHCDLSSRRSVCR